MSDTVGDGLRRGRSIVLRIPIWLRCFFHDENHFQIAGEVEFEQFGYAFKITFDLDFINKVSTFALEK